ncbi:sensor histidine kinase [Streptomyces sp. GESEQ-35]|uniref:sensor histidine kinase n=1 Tax=Streptomyces sp. GESEQ-35 TaxID=2812657 RepID=UPI001FF352DE|nr:histidine kinase [Streptomyces sp. GESEQ-35]
MTDLAGGASAVVSPRLAVALADVRARRERRSRRLRPVLWGIMATIVVQALYSDPAPGLHGEHLVVTLVLAGCLLPLAAVASGLWQVVAPASCVLFCLLITGFGLALGVVQPGSTSVLPPSVAVLSAFLVLPRRQAVVLGCVVVGGLVAAELAGADVSAGNVLSQLLFCVVLALMAIALRQAGDNEERAELLLAQLADARAAEAEAAALAERTRIAQDLHDVLAQTLSGLAVQVQAARRMARRDGAGDDLRELLDRAGKLVKEGLGDARRAVGALRGQQTPSLDRLPELVERYRVDLELDVTLSVTGARRALSTDADLALYRGAQEALTNAARYARGACTTVALRYDAGSTILTVEDRRTTPEPPPAAPVEGSGLGLRGMRERLSAVGGSASAGPTPEGWRVRMEVPV